MIKKIVIQVILIVLVLALQLSLINNLPPPFNNFNLCLSLIIFISIIFSYRLAIIWVLSLGFALDGLLVAPFGLHLVSLFLTVVLVRILFVNLFTNKSIYTILTQGLIGTVAYGILLSVFSWGLFYFKVSDLPLMISWSRIYQLGWEIIFNLIFLAILFFVLWFLSNKLKPQFLNYDSPGSR